MKNAGKVGIGFLIVIGAMVLREVIAGIGAFLYSMYLVSSGKIASNDSAAIQQALVGNSELILLLSAVGMVLWIVIFGIKYYKMQKEKGKSFFEGRIRISRIGALFLMGFGLQFAINSILGSLNLIAPDALNDYSELIETLGMGNSWISFVFIVLIAPVAEELVFRGMVFGYLRRYMSFYAVNIIQAIFFGLYHMNLIQGLYAFVLGLMLGWVVEKYGSIRESILLHMAVNFSGCVVGYIMPDILFESWLGLLGLFIVGLVMLVFSMRTVKMEVVEQVEISEERYDSAQNN